MKWIKDGRIYDETPSQIIYNDRTYINPTNDILLEAGYEIYVEPYDVQLEKAKTNKIEELMVYDSSSAVNECFYNGLSFWLDKATRVGLTNAIEMLKVANKDEIDVWMGDVKLTLPLSTATYMLSSIEVYALDCYNVTSQHRVNIEELETIEEVEQYDYTTGYPDKLYL